MNGFLSVVHAAPGQVLTGAAFLLVATQLRLWLLAMRQRRVLLSVLTALHFLAGFLSLSLMLVPTSSWAGLAGPATAALLGLPWGLYAGAEALSAALAGLTILLCLRYARSYPTPGAVKEALDQLPSGICFGDDRGAAALANLRMAELCRSLTGAPLTDTDLFWAEVLAAGQRQEDGGVTLPLEGRTILFRKSAMDLGNRRFDQITAVDVTERSRISRELREKNDRLRALQRRIREFGRLSDNVINSQEILNARIALHDEVGHLLLTQRYYFEHPERTDEAALLHILRQSSEYLLLEAEEADDPGADPILRSLIAAAAIGVEVEVIGREPEDGEARRVVGRAIAECAANTAKHAAGDRLDARFEAGEGSFTAEFTNTGAPPAGPIRESGGLAALRRLTEASGGEMTVESAPAFRLRLRLPMK